MIKNATEDLAERYVTGFDSFVNESGSEAVNREIRSRMEHDREVDEIKQEYLDKGELSQYLRSRGDKFTFGILKAIFKDSLSAKKNRDLKKGGYKFIHRMFPIFMAGLDPILWLAGTIMGSLRAFNKIAEDAIKNPGNNYPGFLKKIITKTMTVAEGDIKPLLGDDVFYRAFVVSDDITRIMRKDILIKFAHSLSIKMADEPDEKEVPNKYIEDELKKWLNERYDLSYTFPKNQE